MLKYRLLERLVACLSFFFALMFRMVVYLDEYLSGKEDVALTSSLQSRTNCLSVLRNLSMSKSVGRRRRLRFPWAVKVWRVTHGNVRVRVRVQ